jgi:hypothetical protein
MATLNHPLVLRTITLLTAVCFGGLNAQAQYGGGTGTADDPYQIWTAEQMNTIGLHEGDWDKHFKLMADLDLAGVTLNPIGYWTQLDDEDDIPFAGVFDGNGKSIANFSCTDPGADDGNSVSTSLFMYVSGTTAEIRELTMIDPNIDNRRWGIGSLVSLLEGVLSGTALL